METLQRLRNELHQMIDATQDAHTLRHLHQLMATAQQALPKEASQIRVPPENTGSLHEMDTEEATEQWRRFLSCNC